MAAFSPSDAIKILIVDDPLYAAALAGRLASEPDLDVVGTTAGRSDTEAALASAPPDIVLARMQLRTGTAFDILKLVQEAGATAKVVVISRCFEQARVLAALDAGCSGFLTTYQSPDDVVRAVRAAHAGDVALDPKVVKLLLHRVEPEGAADYVLTPREISVLTMLSEGLPVGDIAGRLQLSVHTVRNHVQHILAKLHSHSMLEAVAVARRTGLLDASLE